jgi:hypothetical protein
MQISQSSLNRFTVWTCAKEFLARQFHSLPLRGVAMCRECQSCAQVYTSYEVCEMLAYKKQIPNIKYRLTVKLVLLKTECQNSLFLFSLQDYIGCSYCRLIRRPEHLVGRHWYLQANWMSFIRWTPDQWISQCHASECYKSFYCALFCVFVWVSVQSACALNTLYIWYLCTSS